MVSSIQQVILKFFIFFKHIRYIFFSVGGREMHPIYIEVNLILGIEL